MSAEDIAKNTVTIADEAKKLAEEAKKLADTANVAAIKAERDRSVQWLGYCLGVAAMLIGAASMFWVSHLGNVALNDIPKKIRDETDIAVKNQHIDELLRTRVQEELSKRIREIDEQSSKATEYSAAAGRSADSAKKAATSTESALQRANDAVGANPVGQVIGFRTLLDQYMKKTVALERKKLYSVQLSNHVETAAKTFELVPGMELKFATTEGQATQMLFTAPGTEVSEPGNVPGKQGACEFRIVVDDAQVAIAAYMFPDANTGTNWRNVVLQWAGPLAVGQHSVRVEWRRELSPLRDGKLKVGLGNSTRCLTVRVD